MSDILNELHEQLLDITKNIVNNCEENDIEYYMAWGSCLGAVRHNDIIPWDDDVDMYISYKDYKKLKDIYIKQNDRYFYQDIETDPVYFRFFSKIRKEGTTSMTVADKHMNMSWGICVDLFPLFEYDKPKADKITLFKIFLITKLVYLSYCKEKKSTPVQKAGAFIYRIIGEKNRRKMFFRLMDSIERKGDYYMDLEDNDYKPVIMKKDLFSPCSKKKFGDMEVRVPGNYDKYLSDVYGSDYMKVPEEGSKFRYAHDGIIVDCHKSYKEYMK